MKNLYKILFVILIGFTISSCETTSIIINTSSTSKWIAPKYTNVSKILKVTKEMDIATVSRTLGIPPYDIYTMQADGATILMYNYRIKERSMSLPQTNYQEVTRGTEKSQKEGEIWYQLNSYHLYIIFEKGKMKSMLTDVGRKDGEVLLLKKNNIKFISKNNITEGSSILNYYQK